MSLWNGSKDLATQSVSVVMERTIVVLSKPPMLVSHCQKRRRRLPRRSLVGSPISLVLSRSSSKFWSPECLSVFIDD